MALIPAAAANDPVFVGTRLRRRVTPDGARFVLHKALKALGIADAHRLDFHSFRRAFNTTAHNAGIPDNVARHQTGQTLEVYQGYMVNADPGELQNVVTTVKRERDRWRRVAPQRAEVAPQNEGTESVAAASYADLSDSRRTPSCSRAPRAGR